MTLPDGSLPKAHGSLVEDGNTLEPFSSNTTVVQSYQSFEREDTTLIGNGLRIYEIKDDESQKSAEGKYPPKRSKQSKDDMVLEDNREQDASKHAEQSKVDYSTKTIDAQDTQAGERAFDTKEEHVDTPEEAAATPYHALLDQVSILAEVGSQFALEPTHLEMDIMVELGFLRL